MEMQKLYKGRYLIALYDDNDNLIDVGCVPSELNFYKERPNSFYEQLCRGDIKLHGCNVYLIDCLKKQQDIFAEEDKIFLESIKPSREQLKKIAKQLGISLRTAYRLKAKGKLREYGIDANQRTTTYN